ncbi:MBL fold metallo-hydrolase [Halofilum ochraceum]|uniref:MBL fold metallo-hydrolase n=1 Tax=Halofilum ochraceum TaxID=1611323 RepID=UPI0008D8ED15|nr:MBL fold metallo-hydrolase [Halofilum ochraceum]
MTPPNADERLDTIAEGIYRFDTHYVRPRHTSCTIVVDSGRAAIFDTGVPGNVDALVAAVESLGIAADAVDWVVVSHAHLDHMAGVGPLMQRLPSARVAAHPSAAPHVIDPAKLEKGSRSVFGDEFVDRYYAGVEPVAAERVVETGDGDTLTLGTRELELIYAPGHAWHQQALWDARTATVLAGDAFGVSYPELVGPDGPFVILPTAPPQLAPDAMHETLDRIVGLEPARVQPAHFATIENAATVAGELHRIMDEWLDIALQASSVEDLLERLYAACSADLERRGRGDEAATMRDRYRIDIEVNAQGLWHWRRRREERAAEKGK